MTMFIGGDNSSRLFTKWSGAFVCYCFTAILMAHVMYGRPPTQQHNVQSDICSSTMPCRWAVCPWSSRALFSRNECHPISNTMCRCDRGLRCAIDMASIQAVAHGNQHSIKYSYYCRNPDHLLASHRQQRQATTVTSSELDLANVVIT